MFGQTVLRAAFVGLTLAASSVAARAQEPTPSHIAAARELIQITGALGAIDELMPGFTSSIRQQSVTRPDLAKDLDEVIGSLQPELQTQRSQAQISAARVYAKYLSEPEIREVVAFFKTPTGAKYIKVQPELIDEVVDGIQAWAQRTSEYVMARVRSEMSKKGHQMQ